MEENPQMQNSQTAQTNPNLETQTNQSSNVGDSRTKWIILSLALLILLVTGAGLFLFGSGSKTLTSTTTYNYLKTTPSPTPTQITSVSSSSDVAKVLGEISGTDTTDLEKELSNFDKDSNF